jgi:signal transduction histidine kinase
VSLTVTNTSAPLPSDDPSTLFEPFHRATRGHDAGHGLGLAIVRSIALAHHGHANIETAGDGEFTIEVTLPARAADGGALTG